MAAPQPARLSHPADHRVPGDPRARGRQQEPAPPEPAKRRVARGGNPPRSRIDPVLCASDPDAVARRRPRALHADPHRPRDRGGRPCRPRRRGRGCGSRVSTSHIQRCRRDRRRVRNGHRVHRFGARPQRHVMACARHLHSSRRSPPDLCGHCARRIAGTVRGRDPRLHVHPRW